MASVTLNPTKDASIRSGIPDVNFNGTQLYVGYRSATADNSRSLIEFDISSIPTTATIDSATLSIYAQSTDEGESGNRTYNIHRNTSSWVETGATWNSSPAFDATPDASTVVTANTTGFKTFDLQSLVQEWVDGTTNYGVTIKHSADNLTPRMNYASRTGTAGQEPKLEITYTVAFKKKVLIF